MTPTASFDRTAHPRLTKSVRASLNFYTYLAISTQTLDANGVAAEATQLGIKHIKIKPYTPQTNGKAERFIQTALRDLRHSLRAFRPAAPHASTLAASLQLA